jgi:hypothetical protein
MTAHEDPDHGIKHCHHPYVQTNCHACWNALPNAETTARMHREEILEQMGYAEKLQRWASDQRIRDIPEEFERLRTGDKQKDALVSELRSENEYLRSLLAKSPRKNKPWFR